MKKKIIKALKMFGLGVVAGIWMIHCVGIFAGAVIIFVMFIFEILGLIFEILGVILQTMSGLFGFYR